MAAKPRNPWLSIPLADYEAHMALPQVGQAELLAEVLEVARSADVWTASGGKKFAVHTYRLD